MAARGGGGGRTRIDDDDDDDEHVPIDLGDEDDDFAPPARLPPTSRALPWVEK